MSSSRKSIPNRSPNAPETNSIPEEHNKKYKGLRERTDMARPLTPAFMPLS